MAEAGNVIIVRGGPQGFVEHVTAGHHQLTVDEPAASGGTDRGPDPYDLIAAALGS